ncbi:hypothetical protein D9M71_672690 [compost metagenome]
MRRISAASRISRSPGRKISTSPGPLPSLRSWCASSSRVARIAWSTVRSSSIWLPSSSCSLVSGRYQVSTGKVRPDTSMIGAPSKCLEKRSRSMVAEVMISFRSGRRCNRVFR